MLIIIAVFVRFFLFSAAQPPKKRVIKNQPTAPVLGVQFSSHIANSSPISSENTKATSSSQFPTLLFSRLNLPVSTSKNLTSNGKNQNEEIRNDPSAQISKLISSVMRDESKRTPESLDWFNVLLAQIINKYRNDARDKGRLVTWLNSVLNGERKPDVLDDIKITEINIGEDFPIFSNCKIHRRDNQGNSTTNSSSGSINNPATSHLASNSSKTTCSNGNTSLGDKPFKDNLHQDSDPLKGYKDAGDFVAEMDVDLSDTITLGIETRLMLSQPRWFNTVMPVSLTVSIVRFSARMIVRISRASNLESNERNSQKDMSENFQEQKNTKLVLCISFNPDFTLEVAVRSLLGARSRLQDMPRIGHIIEGLLLKWFTDHFVDPNHREIVLFRYNTEEVRTSESDHYENNISATDLLSENADVPEVPDNMDIPNGPRGTNYTNSSRDESLSPSGINENTNLSTKNPGISNDRVHIEKIDEQETSEPKFPLQVLLGSDGNNLQETGL